MTMLVDTRKCVTNVCNSGCPFPLVVEVTHFPVYLTELCVRQHHDKSLIYL